MKESWHSAITHTVQNKRCQTKNNYEAPVRKSWPLHTAAPCSNDHTAAQNLQTHTHMVLSPKLLLPLWNLSGLFCAESPFLSLQPIFPRVCMLLESEIITLSLSFLFSQLWSYYVAQAILNLEIILSLSPEWWGERYVPWLSGKCIFGSWYSAKERACVSYCWCQSLLVKIILNCAQSRAQNYHQQ